MSVPKNVLLVAMALVFAGTVRAFAAPVVPENEIDQYIAKQLVENRYPSLSVGIVADQKLVFARAYGFADRDAQRKATPETLYCIGSVTKVFTSTLMCMLRDQGKLRLDDPIAQYLPASVRVPTDPRGAPAITLRHLATHTSGLPRIPVNLQAKGEDPYGDYSVEQLYAGLAKTTLMDPIGAKYSYSNLGVGLLGHVLSRAGGDSYESLLKKQLLDPLDMSDTVFSLSAAQRARFALGYKGEPQVRAEDWKLGCLNPAGGLMSNVPDLAKFLALQMRAGQAGVTPVAGGTLTELHTPQRLADDEWKLAVGLAWHIAPTEDIGDIVWHNGGVAGHYSYVGFLPQRKLGVIVLGNRDRQVDEIGNWLLHAVAKPVPTTRPAEKNLPPAEKILDDYVKATGGADAHRRITSLVAHGKARMAGMLLDLEVWQQAPDKFYLKMGLPEAVMMEQGGDGKNIWDVAPLAGVTIHTGQEKEQMLRGTRLHAPLEWRELYKKAECTGVEDLDGRRAYKVVLTPASGPGLTQFYDVENKLLVGSEEEYSGMKVRQRVGDYKKVNGVLMAHRLDSAMAGVEITMTFEKVEANVAIPPERFAPPPAVREKLTTRPE